MPKTVRGLHLQCASLTADFRVSLEKGSSKGISGKRVANSRCNLHIKKPLKIQKQKY